MTQTTNISWATHTWNPIRGCSKVSPGCRNCYAEAMAHRFSKLGQPFFGYVKSGRWSGRVSLVPEKLGEPLSWRTPRPRVFVNSMSDLFHEGLHYVAIAAVFGVMAACPRSTFLVVTKRAAQMAEWFQWLGAQWNPSIIVQRAAQFIHPFPASALHRVKGTFKEFPWPLPNVWLGVSVEDQVTADERIPHLLQCPAAVRWASAEPLLDSIDAYQYLGGERNPIGPAYGGRGLDWLVVGGESGPGARQCQVEWIRSLKVQSVNAGVPVFIKQLGANYCDAESGVGGRRAKTDLCQIRRLSSPSGALTCEWPEDLRVQQYPESDR